MPKSKKEQIKTPTEALLSTAEIYQGHRQRLRDRVLAATVPLAKDIKDYELLEFLLAIAIPRKDVKPLAKTLIYKFTDLAGVITAEPEELMTVPGIKENTAAALRAVYLCLHRLNKIRISKEPVINCWGGVLDYCRTTFGFGKVEKSAVLYLDSTFKIIDDEVLNKGTLNTTFFYPQEVLRKAVTLHAAGVVLIHNHPSCNTNPSDDDFQLTDELDRVLAATGVKLLDHIIVSARGCFSFKNKGYL